MGATTYELDSSHVAMLSHPDRVIDVIRTRRQRRLGESAPAPRPCGTTAADGSALGNAIEYARGLTGPDGSSSRAT